MKFLIIPGFAKSGTTFLHRQISSRTERINVPKLKEIDYFRAGNNLEKYLSFFENWSEEKTFLDASPTYSSEPGRVIKNIKQATKGHDVKILFALRDPFSRAYSHYLHDLSTHFWLTAFFPYNFYSPDVIRHYFLIQFEVVKQFVSSFGRDNVSIFSLSSKEKTLSNMIDEFIGSTTDRSLNFNENPAPGSTIPLVCYDPDHYQTILSGNDYYALPPRCFLMVNQTYSRFVKDFPREIGLQILGNSTTWSRQFDIERLGGLREVIQEDYFSALRHLSVDTSDVKFSSRIIAHENTIIPESITQKLEFLGKADSVLVGSDPMAESPARYSYEEKEITLPKFMKEVRHVELTGTVGERAKMYGDILARYGANPVYADAYIRNLIALGDAQRAIKYMESNPYVLQHMRINKIENALSHFGSKNRPDLIARIRKLISLKGVA